MDIDTFTEDLQRYYELYDKGLKKQANAHIENFVRIVSAWENPKYYEVLYQCYFKYESEGKIRSFQEYCNESGLEQ